MTIPLLDLKRQYHSIKPEIDAAVRRVLESGGFILGPAVGEFERKMAEYCRVKHAIGVASGTDALLLSLRALRIGPGDKVIVPGFTFFATAGAVGNAGAEPVFVDIDRKTYNLAPDKLEETCKRAHLHTCTRIKAIIPVHLYGQPADMDEIMQIAEKFDLYVIEDAAQAIGAEYKGSPRVITNNENEEAIESGTITRGKKAGTIGDLGILSFFPSKNLGAYGDGGMIITGDDELAERIRLLRVHGSKPKYYHHIVGTNSRLDALQAAILSAKLPHLDEWSQARQERAAYYDQLLNDVEEIETPYAAPNRTHIYHQYTIRVKDGGRDELRAQLKEQGIGTGVYYPLPLHLQECFRHLGYNEGELPESERASREVLSLPIFPELTEEEIEMVSEAVVQFTARVRL